MRMVANLGIAVGPALGGFLLMTSQSLPFLVTGTVNLVLAGFTIVYVGETLMRRRDTSEQAAPARGYNVMLADHRFLRFWSAFTLLEVAASLIFVLLPVYSKENFGLLESQFGWLLTINALMVVTLQMALTRWSSRFQPLLVMGVGALFYVAGMIGIALSTEFGGFALSMVVITLGELLVAPTGTAMIANLAPPDMRARYMGIFSLTYTVGSGFGPVMGGFLNDNLAPVAIWYGGALCATISAGWFVWMWRRRKSWTQIEIDPIPAEPLAQEV
jgi:MFS family permease